MKAAAAKLESPIRVLLVDDHRLFAEALEAILAGESTLEVVGRARNGAEAVELTLELVPDIVLMDISMPVMDGVEATRRIREARPDACVLILTGSNAAADVDRSRDAGAAGYITKDRIASQLVEAIVEAASR
jgi:DNA-binding NarL/FixJ family response regulator